ncbi:hypothetical protein L1887_47746 [Cichorium endivia]|nr:hypothetical protein L1887_47746 [Cichorium endivia]
MTALRSANIHRMHGKNKGSRHDVCHATHLPAGVFRAIKPDPLCPLRQKLRSLSCRNGCKDSGPQQDKGTQTHVHRAPTPPACIAHAISHADPGAWISSPPPRRNAQAAQLAPHAYGRWSISTFPCQSRTTQRECALNFAKVAVAGGLCMLDRLLLARELGAARLASEAEAGGVGVVSALLELLCELFRRRQYRVLIHLDAHCAQVRKDGRAPIQRCTWVVYEGDSVVVDARVDDDAAVLKVLVLAEPVDGARSDVDRGEFDAKVLGEDAEFDGATPGLRIEDLGDVCFARLAEHDIRIRRRIGANRIADGRPKTGADIRPESLLEQKADRVEQTRVVVRHNFERKVALAGRKWDRDGSIGHFTVAGRTRACRCRCAGRAGSKAIVEGSCTEPVRAWACYGGHNGLWTSHSSERRGRSRSRRTCRCGRRSATCGSTRNNHLFALPDPDHIRAQRRIATKRCESERLGRIANLELLVRWRDAALGLDVRLQCRQRDRIVERERACALWVADADHDALAVCGK